MIERLKTILSISFAGLLAYLDPISNMLLAIIVIWIISHFIGLTTGLLMQGEKFQWHKAFISWIELFVFIGIVSGIFIIGKLMGDIAGAIVCAKYVSYGFIYYYSIKLLGNLKILFPTIWIISWLYYLVSIEFIKKIPTLDKFKPQDNG